VAAPRATVTGRVVFKRKQVDGDVHITPQVGKQFIVLEEIPELRLKTLPAVGQKIKASGIVRYDGVHKWWELHPLVSWKESTDDR
jgi:hypothetical protein